MYNWCPYFKCFHEKQSEKMREQKKKSESKNACSLK